MKGVHPHVMAQQISSLQTIRYIAIFGNLKTELEAQERFPEVKMSSLGSSNPISSPQWCSCKVKLQSLRRVLIGWVRQS